jgi:hypothetical protein
LSNTAWHITTLTTISTLTTTSTSTTILKTILTTLMTIKDSKTSPEAVIVTATLTYIVEPHELLALTVLLASTSNVVPSEIEKKQVSGPYS